MLRLNERGAILSGVFYGILLLFLYLNANIYTAVFFTLILGISILLPVSHFYFNCAKIKYNYALYYLCTDFNLSVNEIINKSNNCSDGFIKDGVILKNVLIINKYKSKTDTYSEPEKMKKTIEKSINTLKKCISKD